ncbi:MAG: amidohydrolase family protein [Candidatus Sumerlaeia bacterium]|nr:amidohydrolase family protein [Candidatus Sumerlaeia bacterium]
MTRLRRTARLLAALALLAPALPAQDLLIRDARVVPVDREPIESASVLVLDGRIAAVGEVAEADAARVPGANRIDGAGLTVYPGFFAGYSQLGLVEVSAVDVTDDTDEGTDQNTAQVLSMDSYNPLSELIPVTRMNGVTAVLAAPSGGNVFAGRSAVMALDGMSVDDTTVKSPAALHITLGEAPKVRYGGKDQMPMTRMGLAAYIRGEFTAAREYAESLERHSDKVARHYHKLEAHNAKLAEWGRKPEAERGDRPEPPEAPEPPARDFRKEALASALRGEIPVAMHAERLDDIQTALRIAEEFKLRAVLVGGSEAYKVRGLLARRDVPVVLATTEQPAAMDTLGAIYENARLLHEAGVKIAFVAADRTHNVRNIPYEAGLAVAWGLPYDAALRGLTLNAAEVWGVDAELGSVTVGKRADLVVAEGDPLQPATPIRHVIIGGRDIPLESRQTKLAERFGAEFLPRLNPAP